MIAQTSQPSGRPEKLGVWSLAWPTVATNLLQSLVGFVDVIIVADLGPAAVAAATAGLRLFLVLQTFLTAINVGTIALVARAVGAGAPGEASHVLRQSLQLGGLVAIVLGGLGVVFASTLATWSGLQGAAHDLAHRYIQLLSAFIPCFAVMYMISSATRAAGDALTPLAIGGISNVANVILLCLFVRGELGAPKLGITGAALSGGLSFAVGAMGSWLAWRTNRLAIRWATPESPPRESRLCELTRIGYPVAVEQSVVQLGLVAFTTIIARVYGTAAIAAYGIGLQVLSLSIVMGSGFSIAAGTLVGQHLGARAPALAARSGWRAMWLAVGAMLPLSIAVATFARPIARAMIADPEVVALTVEFIYVLAAALPLLAVDFVLTGSLHGAGDTRYPLVATFVGLAVGRLALGVLIIALKLPVAWAYGTILTEVLIRAGFLLVRFRSNRWHLVATGQSEAPMFEGSKTVRSAPHAQNADA